MEDVSSSKSMPEQVQSHAHLQVRLARSADEVDAAQALRYSVFYEEMGATPSETARARRRDADALDERCDHLVVHDPLQADPEKAVVGTYRLNRLAGDDSFRDFYSSSEFDLGAFANFEGVLLELGRSCVAPAYRCRSVTQLLWRGVCEYVASYNVGLMFGCASLPGADARAHSNTLSYLHHNHLARETIRVAARADRRAGFALLPEDAVDRKAALTSLPPLMKGYLRAGAVIGDGAVEDHQFGVTDVCIIVETSRITQKYARKFVETARTLALAS